MCVLFCIIMSIISVKCTKIQYLQSCVCAENLIYSYENPQKLLPPELLLLPQICTKSFAGFTPDPTGGAYSAPPDSLAGLGGGPPGEGKGGGRNGEGEERRGTEGEGEGEGEKGMAVDSGTVFHLTLDQHKLCLFSVTV